ncbi:related to PAF acetylhydrolase family protein [Fusarium torulosum]|uniref:1-alkyl-2-acetylglycerophosphocholine esterase n=1 Tax=Fusarium torulosum TaxID=33205 RepID=A0AAE8M046_9HYPO|nr:related to PAF acetylhydrolase family protein [Fusarium torulosum]
MHVSALTVLFGATQALIVPSPLGPYDVAVKHFELVDQNRIDPFAPEANTKRRIMASAYLPIDSYYGCKAQTVPYMPPLTASVFGEEGESLGIPQGTLESFEMEFCDISTVNSKKGHRSKKTFPVAIFSPGARGSRLVYGAMARSLASLGYVILTLDQTYETYVVEFPDGSAVYALADEPGVLPKLEARTRDVSFLISQLRNKTITDSVFARFPGTFDPNNIAVYGHSFGGSTAAVTVQRDPRVVGGLNFDGPINGSVRYEGFKDKPFVIVDTKSFDFPEWPDFYKKIDAAKMMLEIKNTQHYAFTDVPLLLTVLKVSPESQPLLDEVFGKLDGRKVEKAMNQIMVGLMDMLFKKNTRALKKIGKNVNIKVLRDDLPKHI